MLGPLLFIVALTDLLKELREAGIPTAVFADDLTIAVRNFDTMDIIERWTRHSCMEVNIQKTFGMMFCKSTDPNNPFDEIKAHLSYKGEEIHIHRE